MYHPFLILQYKVVRVTIKKICNHGPINHRLATLRYRKTVTNNILPSILSAHGKYLEIPLGKYREIPSMYR